MQQGALPLAALALLAVCAMTLLRRQVVLHYRQHLLLRCPIVGKLVRGQRLSQIFTVLSLTRSGITFLQGLENVRDTLTCPYWRGVLQQAHQDITLGASISAALAKSGNFTPLCIQLIHTGGDLRGTGYHAGESGATPQ